MNSQYGLRTVEDNRLAKTVSQQTVPMHDVVINVQQNYIPTWFFVLVAMVTNPAVC